MLNSSFPIPVRPTRVLIPAAPFTRDLFDGNKALFAVSPIMCNPAWANKGYPLVRVEVGYGSKNFQDLYPGTDDNLYNRFGVLASTAYSGSKLLVETPYNQFAFDPYSSSHPVPMDPSYRVLLDVDASGAPFFAGYGTDTQDSNQHATIRAYSTNIRWIQNASSYFSIMALDSQVGSEQVELFQDNVDGGTRFVLNNSGANQYYENGALAVAKLSDATFPQFKQQWARNFSDFGRPTKYSQNGMLWGVTSGQNSGTAVSSTSYALNLFGPVAPLKGKVWMAALFENEILAASMNWSASTSIPKRWAPFAAKSLAANQFAIVYPTNNATIPIDLVAVTATIPIKIVGRPGVTYEAHWKDTTYVALGTADASTGILESSLTAQPVGTNTLTIRETSSGTTLTRTGVAVGIVIAIMGESEIDGRGHMFANTIPAGSLRKNGTNLTALGCFGTNTPTTDVGIHAGGAGYTVGDTLTFVGGTGTAAHMQVGAVDGSGAVTAWKTNFVNCTAGTYTAVPTNPIATTGGTGTGCTIDVLAWGCALSPSYSLLVCQALYNQFACPLAIIQLTLGSTGVVSPTFVGGAANWDPNAAPGINTSTFSQSINQLMLNQAELVLPNFFLMHFGVNDAAFSASSAQFVAYYTAMGTAYRNDVNSSFVISLPLNMSATSASAANTDNIRAAQKTLWGTAGYEAAGSFAQVNPDLADGVHTLTVAQKQIEADTVIRYWRHHWLGGSQARAPQYSSGAVVGGNLQVTFTGGTSPFTHSGGSSEVIGWKVSDANGARTVTNVAISGLVVTLTCDQALSGAVTLQWASNASIIGTTLLDSDATTPLPPEPFGPVTI